MASKRWEAMPANDGPDIDAGEWQVFRVLDTGDEQWLGGAGDKEEMTWTAEYARALEEKLTIATEALSRIAPFADYMVARQIALNALKDLAAIDARAAGAAE